MKLAHDSKIQPKPQARPLLEPRWAAGISGLLILAVATAALADYRKAQDYFAKEEYQAAVIELKNELQRNPEHVEARRLLGQVSLRLGDAAGAEKELRRAASLGQDDAQLNNLLAEALLAQGKIDDSIGAIEAFSYADSGASEGSAAQTILGRAHMAKNQIADAKQAYERAADLELTPEVLVGLAQVAFVEGDRDQSLALLEQALAMRPGAQQVLMAKGQVLAARNEMRAAVAAFSEILDANPTHLAALLARAEAQFALLDTEAAFRDARAALRLNADQPQSNQLLARLLMQQGDYEAAQAAAERVLRVVPEDHLTHFLLGTIHYARQNFAQAQFYLAKFVAWQPQHAAGSRLLGATYMAVGEQDAAVQLLESFDQRFDHQDPQLLNILGRALLESGQAERGLEVLNRALALDPESEGLRNQVALGALATGDTRAAIEMLEQDRAEMSGGELSRLMLILSYIREEDFDAAAAVIDENIQANPSQPLFQLLRGINFEAQGQLPAARAAYREAETIKADYVPAKLSLAKLDVVAGDLDTAAARYHEILRLQPGHLQALVVLAEISRQRNDMAGYVSWLQQARERNADVLAPVRLLVEHYLQRGETEKALNEMSGYRNRRPEDMDALALLAKINIAQGQLDQARANLARVAQANDNDLVSRLTLAQIMDSQGDIQAAQRTLEQVLRVNPRYLPALLFKTRLAIKEQEFDAARNGIALIRELQADSHLPPQLEGEIALKQGDSATALKHFSAAFERAPTAELVRLLHQQYARTGEWDEGIRVLVEYLAAQPTDMAVKMQLALSYQQAGRNREAIAIYEELHRAQPRDAVVLNNLAWLYWVVDDARSLDYAQRSYELSPERPEVADTLGWIMLHKGDKKKALSILQDAAGRAPTNPDIRYHLAKAMADNGDRDQAKRELQRLLRDYPSFSEQASAQALLEQL